MPSSTEIPSFVKTLYRNILDYDLEDQASIDYWTNHVRFHGISSTISMLFSSDDFRAMNLSSEAIVDKLYSSILGREGEWDGKNYFLRRLRRGDPMQTIVDDFVKNTEYRQKAQTVNVSLHDDCDIPIFTWNPTGGLPDFIKTLYQNILGRDPLPDDHPNIDDWMNHTHLHGIASTISGFFTSDEFEAKNFKFPPNKKEVIIADKLYRSILGREGGWDGKKYWIDRLKHGETVQAVVSDFIESEEYRQKAQAGIVPLSGIPILTWHSPGATITGVSTTDEFQAKKFPHEDIVDKLYRSILGCECRGEERTDQVVRLADGVTICNIVNDLVGSDEYRQKAQLGAVPFPDIPIFTWNPANRMPHFVKTLYQNILSRDPDNEEVSHWTEFTRFFRIASTIGGIFTTDEFQAKQFPHEAIVDKFYRSILSRECRGEERTDQVVRLRDGVTICTVVNDLVGSVEYREKAQLGAVPPPDTPIFEWHLSSGEDDFARTLYQNILSRDPEEGASHGRGDHIRFHGIASAIKGFITSKEFHLMRLPHEDVVDKLYRSILGRESTDVEKTEQVLRLRNGDSTSIIINGLLGSEEYRHRVELGAAPSPIHL